MIIKLIIFLYIQIIKYHPIVLFSKVQIKYIVKKGNYFDFQQIKAIYLIYIRYIRYTYVSNTFQYIIFTTPF